MRLEGKIAVIIGAGQSPGEGIGNGRATTLRFAREGAKILAVDRSIGSAAETAAMAVREGGECVPFEADVTREESLAEAIEAAQARWGRIDILHNNVGVSVGGGDKPLDEFTEEIFDRISAINLRGTIMACKHVCRLCASSAPEQSSTFPQWRRARTAIRWSPTRQRRRQ